jgi:hypothetical protein
VYWLGLATIDISLDVEAEVMSQISTDRDRGELAKEQRPPQGVAVFTTHYPS